MSNFHQCLLGMTVQSYHTWHIKIFLLLNLIQLSGIAMATLLNDLDPTKSSGPDRIPTKLLKILATEVSPCLQQFFSASLNQCTVPSEWKKALIFPLFKKETERTHQIIGQCLLLAYAVKSWNILYTAISCHT